MTEQIIERLLYLRNWELANVFLIPAAIALLFSSGVFSWQGFTWPTQMALGLVLSLLLQGSYYWHLKLKSLQRRKRQLPPHFRKIFLPLKWLNIVFLVGYPLLVFGLVRPQNSAYWWSLSLYVLALLEHINYFGVQLMHDTANDWRYLIQHRRLRRSPLAIDLRFAKTDNPKSPTSD